MGLFNSNDEYKIKKVNEQLAQKAERSYRASDVFVKTVDFGSEYFRIPFMCVTKHGTIIAGSDIRRHSASDYGDIDCGIARSEDDGKTWVDKRVLFDNGTSYRAIDSCIIYDEVNDKIYVFTNKLINDPWNEIPNDANYDVVYKTSVDDGKTWSDEISIKYVLNGFSDRQIFLNGVGSGIVMADGTIVLPVQVSKVNATPYPIQSTIVYSADGGTTWTMATGLVPEKSTECNVVEYEPNKLIINARTDDGKRRALYASTNMGDTWLKMEANSETSPNRLVQIYGTMGSTIKVKLPNLKEKILYSAPHNNFSDQINGRGNISIMFSNDKGKTWKMAGSVFADPTSGYSCMAYRDGKLYILLEVFGVIKFIDASYLLPVIMRDDIIWNLEPADTTAPNEVTNLTATPSDTSVSLSWTASDSTDVASYDVYNGSTLLGNVTGATYNVSGLTVATQYTFTVKAKDSSGNVSTGVSVTTTTLAESNPPIVSDTFDRADNTTSLGTADTGQTWSVLGGGVAGISSNEAYWSSLPTAYTAAVVDSGVSDCGVSIQMTTLVNNIHLAFRSVDENNYFMVRHNNGNYDLIKRSSGSSTLIGSYSGATSGDTIKVNLSSSNISVLINGVEQIIATDTFNQTATKHGFGGYQSTSGRFDNFQIEELTTA